MKLTNICCGEPSGSVAVGMVAFRAPGLSRLRDWVVRRRDTALDVMKRRIGLRILNCAAILVLVGGGFDMLIPEVPSNLVGYLGVTKGDVSPELSLLLLGLLRALGGCLVAIGLTALLIINGPLKRGETWAVWPLLILIGLSETINASQMWRFGSPYYFPLIFVVMTIVGVILLPRKPEAVL